MIVKLLLLIFLVFQPSHKSCPEIQQELGGVEWEFVDYNVGWENYKQTTIDNVSPFEGGILYTLNYAPEQNTVYYMWFWDLVATYDENGEHYGLHHLCAVKKEIGDN